MRARLAVFLLVLIVEGCAATAPSDGAARKPPSLPLGELLLMGFGGTQVEGNEEVRSLVCDVKVGGLILFERDSRSGEARNISSAEQVRQLTSDLQALARSCTGRRLLIAADNEGGLVMRLSTRLGYLPTPPPHIRAITDHVYFYLDRKSPLWSEFSKAASIGMHFSGDWPELELHLWAILEERQ